MLDMWLYLVHIDGETFVDDSVTLCSSVEAWASLSSRSVIGTDCGVGSNEMTQSFVPDMKSVRLMSHSFLTPPTSQNTIPDPKEKLVYEWKKQKRT
jgi:hypothetical protein